MLRGNPSLCMHRRQALESTRVGHNPRIEGMTSLTASGMVICLIRSNTSDTASKGRMINVSNRSRTPWVLARQPQTMGRYLLPAPPRDPEVGQASSDQARGFEVSKRAPRMWSEACETSKAAAVQ